jgi:hypothetical protein
MKQKSRGAKWTFGADLRLARRLWPGQIPSEQAKALEDLSRKYGITVMSGDLRLLDGRWYVNHSGLIHLATRRRCLGIRVEPVLQFCDPLLNRWVFKATVHKSSGSRGFVGYGDADPSNISSLVRGTEMRVAETRAVNRALRKAYGIGLCSVEELGAPRSSTAPSSNHHESSPTGTNGYQNGQPRLRDRLCLLIRQHRLDATLVKAFAADYCGTSVLRDASREAVEAFINDLAQRATSDRDGLLSHLNTYGKTTEVNQ